MTCCHPLLLLPVVEWQPGPRGRSMCGYFAAPHTCCRCAQSSAFVRERAEAPATFATKPNAPQKHLNGTFSGSTLRWFNQAHAVRCASPATTHSGANQIWPRAGIITYNAASGHVPLRLLIVLHWSFITSCAMLATRLQPHTRPCSSRPGMACRAIKLYTNPGSRGKITECENARGEAPRIPTLAVSSWL
jgi:hypothetical protein